jgi:thiamine biosynthesis lipoprotein
MASPITVQARRRATCPDPDRAVDDAITVFHDVDETCTRFSPDSDLMRANARGEQWTVVAPRCFDALVEAHAAYRRTLGRFDPRVLDDLVRLGYEQSYTRAVPAPRSPTAALAPRTRMADWTPAFRSRTQEVRLGRHAVDLGGIGKGLAVRWASERLRTAGLSDFLVAAGGDCYCAGTPSDAPQWRAAVEDPRGGSDPVAVLDLRDEAVATSSVRLRSWQVGDRLVHHLVDPTTGLPGGEGLLAVTVVDEDPASAEVWSKVLFLAGARGVATSATHFGVPALWVTTDGDVKWSSTMDRRLTWTAPL